MPIDAGTMWELFKGDLPFGCRKMAFFMVPRVLQICEVILERDLLGMSGYEIQGVKTTSQETVDNNDFQNVDWD